MNENNNPLNILEDETPWYREGVKFKCTGCGQCCTGAPGAVWISDEEVKEMSAFLDISVDDFLKQYTRLIDGKRSLIEDDKSYDCVFLEDNRCSIYKVRPLQCRTYPWWPSNLQSQKDWNDAAKWCEGINHPDANCVTANEIQLGLKMHVDGGGH